MSQPTVPPRGGWLSIASAPKDTVVLLYGKQQPIGSPGVRYQGRLIFSGYWDALDDAWCCTGSSSEGPFFAPTHWQPLPAPPGDEPDVSPELRDHPPRERVEAALDKAVRALEHIAARPITESYSVAVANMALRDIAELRR